MIRKPLSEFARNVTSQFGEDGILAEILTRVGAHNRTCVEFGAWDGKYLSNTWDLWHNHGWRAILIEGEAARYAALKEGLRNIQTVTAIHALVTAEGVDSLGEILSRSAVPTDFDVLSIDIDGDEYYVWKGLTEFLPRIVVVEYNPTIPPELDLVQVPGAYFGASARALTRLAHEKGYGLACCTETNCIFVSMTEFGALGMKEPTLEEVFPRGNLSYVINSYDGGAYLTRNPTYSPQAPPLSVSRLADELFRALRTPAAQPAKAPVQAADLARVKIFAIPSEVALRPIWRRFLTRGLLLMTRLLLGDRGRALSARWSDYVAARRLVADWIKAGKPAPPPHPVKQRAVREYAKRHGTRVLVETGTYHGDMVWAMRKQFKEVFSIELSPELHQRASERFAACPHVHIIRGDSATALEQVLKSITEPALFWLDGHYSGGITAKGDTETPVLSEIDAICRQGVERHVILVDDARCFDGGGDYPTLAELKQFVLARRPAASFEVRDDIIRIT